jgi:hypothetical protein
MPIVVEEPDRFAVVTVYVFFIRLNTYLVNKKSAGYFKPEGRGLLDDNIYQ